jgi:hypothetical protein
MKSSNFNFPLITPGSINKFPLLSVPLVPQLEARHFKAKKNPNRKASLILHRVKA